MQQLVADTIDHLFDRNGYGRNGLNGDAPKRRDFPYPPTAKGPQKHAFYGGNVKAEDLQDLLEDAGKLLSKPILIPGKSAVFVGWPYGQPPFGVPVAEMKFAKRNSLDASGENRATDSERRPDEELSDTMEGALEMFTGERKDRRFWPVSTPGAPVPNFVEQAFNPPSDEDIVFIAPSAERKSETGSPSFEDFEAERDLSDDDLAIPPFPGSRIVVTLHEDVVDPLPVLKELREVVFGHVDHVTSVELDTSNVPNISVVVTDSTIPKLQDYLEERLPAGTPFEIVPKDYRSASMTPPTVDIAVRMPLDVARVAYILADFAGFPVASYHLTNTDSPLATVVSFAYDGIVDGLADAS